MGKKIIDEFPKDVKVLYKSHIPSLEVIEVTVHSIYYHKGNDTFENRDNFSIELLDPNGQILPRMVCHKLSNGTGYLLKNNLHFTKEEAYKRIAKNVHSVLTKNNPGIEIVDKSIIEKNLEILKNDYPHLLI